MGQSVQSQAHVTSTHRNLPFVTDGHSTSVVRLPPKQTADDEPVLITWTFFEGRRLKKSSIPE